MFDVGFSELMLLFVIGLLVLGPQRLPKVAAEIGKWVGRARRTANELRRQLEREIELAEVIQPPRPSPPATNTEGNSTALSATAEPAAESGDHPEARPPGDPESVAPTDADDTATETLAPLADDTANEAAARLADDREAEVASRTPPAG